jgi:hypothetical protein
MRVNDFARLAAIGAALRNSLWHQPLVSRPSSRVNSRATASPAASLKSNLLERTGIIMMFLGATAAD